MYSTSVGSEKQKMFQRLNNIGIYDLSLVNQQPFIAQNYTKPLKGHNHRRPTQILSEQPNIISIRNPFTRRTTKKANNRYMITNPTSGLIVLREIIQRLQKRKLVHYNPIEWLSSGQRRAGIMPDLPRWLLKHSPRITPFILPKESPRIYPSESRICSIIMNINGKYNHGNFDFQPWRNRYA